MKILLSKVFDSIVSDDENMYQELLKVMASSKEHSGNLQNALRCYYVFVNGKTFPKVLVYNKWIESVICERI